MQAPYDSNKRALFDRQDIGDIQLHLHPWPGRHPLGGGTPRWPISVWGLTVPSTRATVLHRGNLNDLAWAGTWVHAMRGGSGVSGDSSINNREFTNHCQATR